MNVNEYLPLIKDRLIDFVRVHMSDIGGLTPMRKLAALCEYFGVRIALHGPGDCSPVGMMANLAIDIANQRTICLTDQLPDQLADRVPDRLPDRLPVALTHDFTIGFAEHVTDGLTDNFAHSVPNRFTNTFAVKFPNPAPHKDADIIADERSIFVAINFPN